MRLRLLFMGLLELWLWLWLGLGLCCESLKLGMPVRMSRMVVNVHGVGTHLVLGVRMARVMLKTRLLLKTRLWWLGWSMNVGSDGGGSGGSLKGGGSQEWNQASMDLPHGDKSLGNRIRGSNCSFSLLEGCDL